MNDRLNFEEMELDKYIESIDKKDIPVPSELDERINKRIEGLKGPKNYHIKSIAAVAAGVCILFVGGVKLSPQFAAYASSIPGIGNMVEWLQGDRGIRNARNHGYGNIDAVVLQEEGYTLAIDNIMFDEDRLHLSSVVSGDKIKELITKTREDGKPVKVGSEDASKIHSVPRIEMNFLDFKGGSVLQSVKNGQSEHMASEFERTFEEGEVKEFLKNSPEKVRVEVRLFSGNDLIHEFSEVNIAFDEADVMRSRIYEQNQRYSFDNMDLSIKKLIISPTRIKIEFSPKMGEGFRFTGFENPHIKDDKGNIYKPEGLVFKYSDPEKRSMYFVPSVYFEELPDKLYFCFDGIRIASDEGIRFSASLNDAYPKIIKYMEEQIVIEEFDYVNGRLNIKCQVPDENVLKIQNIKEAGSNGANGWSTHKETDSSGNEVSYIKSLIDTDRKDSYELEFEFPGYFVRTDTSLELNLD